MSSRHATHARTVLFCAAVLGAAAAPAQDRPRRPPVPAVEPVAGPHVSVTPLLARDRVALSGEPLAFSVAFSNSLARNLATSNAQRRELRELLQKDEEFAKRPAEERERELAALQEETLPVFAVGTSARPLASLFRVEVRAPGNDAPLAVAGGLRSNGRTRARAELDGGSYLVLHFGLTTDEIARLAPGRYVVQAILDTRAEQGMWQGRAVSSPLPFELRAAAAQPTADEAAARDWRTARFLLLDDQLDAAETHARRAVEAAPTWFPAHELLGDIRRSRGDRRGALESYRQAIRVYGELRKELAQRLASEPQDRPGSRFIEDPQHLHRKLHETAEEADKP